MQSLAFLWFQLQMTQQYLNEKTFRPAQSRANSANLNRPTGADTLRSEPALDLLREREDFKKLMAEIEALNMAETMRDKSAGTK